jgi:hypothetical protein
MGAEMKTVPCKWCGTPTPMTGTRLCNRCWELDSRIGLDLDLAEKIVARYRRHEAELLQSLT